MGRHHGFLALMAGIAGGAEVTIIPEVETDPEILAAELHAAYERGKPHAIVVVAEGARYNGEALARYFRENRERLGFEVRVTILGHVQRGADPGAFDRILATRLGAAATGLLVSGQHGILVGFIKGEIAATPLAEVAAKKKGLDLNLLELAKVLAK
jgi:6-phosphofructokinase 1